MFIFSDRLIKIFHLIEETQLLEELSSSPYAGHTYSINQIDFNPDGSKLVSCSLDGTTVVWDTKVIYYLEMKINIYYDKEYFM